VQITTPGALAERLSAVQVFDVNGREVMHQNVEASANPTINVAPWPQGVYFFQAITEKGHRYSGKFLKY
jgi:hypothetical protein